MRSIWKGHIRFSLVTIPIRIYNAIDTEEKISFQQLHKEDNGAVGYEKKCKKCGKSLTAEEIVKGYQFEPEQYVIVSAEDLAKIRESGSSTRMVAESLLSDLLPAVGRIVEIQSTEAIKQSVIAGLGVAVLSSWATKLEERAGLLRPVRDSRLKRQRRFYLVRREDRALTATAAALWDCLATCEPAAQAWAKRRSPY